MIRLSPRLEAIGRLIPVSSRVADVGTDHGYLPIWLIEGGISPFVIATDLRPGPLEAAKENAGRAGIREGLSFRLADGLEAVLPHEVDVVVMAGMGGETIGGIIRRTPWLKEGTHRLILQPQSKIPRLMDELAAAGCCVLDQHLAAEAGRIYPIYEVVPGSMEALRGGARYIHPALLRRGDPLLGAYLAGLRAKLRRALFGLEQGGGKESNKWTELHEALGDFDRWKGEGIS